MKAFGTVATFVHGVTVGVAYSGLGNGVVYPWERAALDIKWNEIHNRTVSICLFSDCSTQYILTHNHKNIEENMIDFVRGSFRVFNKLFMVPMFRLGFGPFMGNQITGYIMVLKTAGRKTGKLRYSPVNYAIHHGNVYCLAGFGQFSDWYLNMIGTRKIEAILPSGSIYGVVEDVNDLDERRVILRKILQNAGFAGFFEGFNPFKVSDKELLRKTANMPILRICPAGIGNGASDPGGLSWAWTPVSLILIILIIIAIVR